MWNGITRAQKRKGLAGILLASGTPGRTVVAQATTEIAIKGGDCWL